MSLAFGLFDRPFGRPYLKPVHPDLPRTVSCDGLQEIVSGEPHHEFSLLNYLIDGITKIILERICPSTDRRKKQLRAHQAPGGTSGNPFH